MSLPRFLLRFPFGNQELITLNVVTHNILAMEEKRKKKNNLDSQHLFYYIEIRNPAILLLEHEVPRPFIFPQLANVLLSSWKFLFIPLWLWRIMQIQVWVQRSHNFNRLGFDTTWSLSWLEKSRKHSFQRLPVTGQR